MIFTQIPNITTRDVSISPKSRQPPANQHDLPLVYTIKEEITNTHPKLSL